MGLPNTFGPRKWPTSNPVRPQLHTTHHYQNKKDGGLKRGPCAARRVGAGPLGISINVQELAKLPARMLRWASGNSTELE